MIKYNKLVRDAIPEIIRADNLQPVIHIADEDEYQEKLHAKLHEEVNEFLHEPSLEEAADVAEVVLAICQHYNLDTSKLEAVRLAKRTKRGGFEQKIILESVM